LLALICIQRPAIAKVLRSLLPHFECFGFNA